MADEAELAERDRVRLAALRRAAADIRRSSVIDDPGPVQLSVSAEVGRGIAVGRVGPDEERFRSFTIALRKTYAQNDSAHFLSAINVISKLRPDDRDRVKAIRDEYLGTLNSNQIQLEGLSHEAVFQAWLYGGVFHDDDDELRETWNKLSGNPLTGPVATMLVQATAIRLAQVVLIGDDLIADFLGEERLPPVGNGARDEDAEVAWEGPEFRASARPARGRGVYYLDFANVGPGDAVDVSFDGLVPVDEAREELLVAGEIELKFPVPRLREGEVVSLMAAPTMGTARMYEATISWADRTGRRTQDTFRIDLYAGTT